MPLSRKHFIAATALGMSAAAYADLSAAADAAVERAPISFHVLKPGEFDKAAMLSTLTVNSQHKQVFQSVVPLIIAPGIASLYMHMQNSMNAYQFSLGLGNLSTLGVIIGPSIVLGLNDAMWKKYGFGQGLGKDLGLAASNVYYQASSNLDPSADPDDPKGLYQDWSAQAVLKRGGQFFLCHNAMSGVAMLVAMKMNTGDPKAILAEWEKNVLPGFQVVPAGVAAMQQAQENGWKPFSII
jgi:hypothetical protein